MSTAGARTATHAGYRPAVAPLPFWSQPATLAVLGALTFNFALCFLNTNVSSVGTSAAIGCEIAIILAVLLYAFPVLDYSRLLVIGSAILFLITLAAIRFGLGGGIDVKPVRDLLIPIAFFLLGARACSLRHADRIVTVAVIVVIAVGAFEYFVPDIFTRFFNVAGFYIERGTMDAAQAQQSSNLFVSGMRPEGATGGRGLFPMLGNHRVSSVFLEPVSAGNFGIVIFAWALVRSLMERKVFWGWFLSAGVVIVMADSRFGANFCAFCVLLALLPAAIRTGAVAVLPVGALLALLLLPAPLSVHYGIDNGFIGRIILSGRILERFDALNWLGVQAPAFITSDSGYAYAVGGFGIAGLAFFWTMLLATEGRNGRFYLLRDLAAAYVATLLCISNSPFTIKTGALLWFLVGVLSRVTERVRSGGRGSMQVHPTHGQPTPAR